MQNCPKFEQGVLNNVGRPHKKMRQKKTKKKQKFLGEGSLFPECPVLALGKGPLPRVPGKALGEEFFLSFNAVGGVNRQVTCFFAECRSSPSVALGEESLCRVLLFTECRISAALRKAS